MDLLQLTPISGVGLRTGGDQPNDSYVEVMMQYSDAEGSWKIKKDYRGEMMVCAHISIHNFNYKSKGLSVKVNTVFLQKERNRLSGRSNLN